VKIKHL